MTEPPARGRSRALIAAIAALLVAIGGVLGAFVAPSDAPPPPPPPAATATATPTSSATPAPAGDLQAEPAAPGQPATEAPAESDLRDETPPGVPKSELKQGEKAAKDAAKDLPAKERPVGGAQNYSCPDDHKGEVWSSRNGAKVMQFVLHYTVSANVPGRADVLGIRDYFARTRVGSAHLILDFEGNCIQTVPWDQKAWTEGFFNSVSDSVEIIATGRETRAQWLAAPIIRDRILASIVRDRLRARGLPRRRVDPVGCVAQLGVTDHNALECGNSHTDVAPNFPWDVFMQQLAEEPAPAGLAALLPGERKAADCLIAERKSAQRHGGWSNIPPSHLRRASGCKAALKRADERLRRAGVTSTARRAARHKAIQRLI
jgi:hypothetical protein